jgi:hypothetical protein
VLEAGGQDRQLVTLDAPVTGLVPYRDGLLAAAEAGCWLIDGLDRAVPRISALMPWRDGRPQALCADAAGHLWACQGAADGRRRVGR